MVAFGVEVKGDNPKLLRYIKNTNKNLRDNDVLKNPFNGVILNAQEFLAVYINPIYFNFPKYVCILLMGMGLVLRIYAIWFWVIFFVFLLLNSFWSSWFYYIILKIGLKKVGYNDIIKYISPKNTLERLIIWDKEKL
jgi:hypothetical protein